MKTLYESLLGGFDEIERSGWESILQDTVEAMDKALDKAHTTKRYAPSKLEGDILRVGLAGPATFSRKTLDLLKPLNRKITLAAPLNTRSFFMVRDCPHIDDVVKGFLANTIVISNCGDINNIDFTLDNETNDCPRISFANNYTSKNIFNNIHVSNLSNNLATISFGYFPEFKNVTFKGVGSLSIEQKGLFKLTDIFESMVDKTYKYTYLSPKNGEEKTKNMSFDSLRTLITGAEKRWKIIDDNLPIFKINPKFKLNDLLDIKFDSNLYEIIFWDTKFRIIFQKHKPAYRFQYEGYIFAELPNDPGWWVILEKEI